ncbi:MAG: FGGY-family carbohydrate kinase [Promethearchaeota archaeon]|nr:MAG: FGGY-family carbohydrate kinase [Candidatus Lokiarchaeota archaeon]
MGNSDKILSIDISSKKVKVGIISDRLELETVSVHGYDIIDEDVDGFAKRFDMDDMWNKIKLGIKNVIKQNKPETIIGISSCGQRMATVFLDKQGMEIYGGPNTDIRGIDSAYLIEDKFSEEELFKITAHTPSLMFTLARLLWFQEEEEDQYENIGKVLMLDDWIVYKFTGEFFTDYTSIGESQLFDISKKRWSSEIIEAFNINYDILPEIVDSGTIVGELKSDLKKKFGINQKSVPVLKGCGDTQANLLGMGVIEEGNIGISLGTTTPVHLVIEKPIIDSDLNFWTDCHVIKDKWLIEANTGGTGRVYDWFKDAFISSSEGDADEIMNNLLSRGKPGSGSIFAYLGPELMALKDQTSIKRGVFVFPPPSMIGEELPKLENFARSAIENICFGIYENFQALHQFVQSEITTFCSGGMSKSREFCEILTNILDKEIMVPLIRDSAFIGNAIITLLGLKQYPNYKAIINEFMKYDTFNIERSISEEYKSIYKQWKNLKKKIDDL